MPKTSNRRYDHHKKKTKKRNGLKKNKTGKNRGKIQVGGGDKPCPFCTRFSFNDKYNEMLATCTKRTLRKAGVAGCEANVAEIKKIYDEKNKKNEIYDTKANDEQITSINTSNNKCRNCGLDNKKFSSVDETKINDTITIALTDKTEKDGIPKFEDIKKNLKKAKGKKLSSGFFGFGGTPAETKPKTEAPSTPKAPGKQKESGDEGEAGPAAATGESVPLQEELEAKQEELDAKQGEIDALNASAVQTQADHDATIEGLKAEHETEKQEIKDQHQIELDNTIDSQNLAHSQEIDKIKEENKREITKLKSECNEYEKEAKSVIKIGDNISFKIVDEDGDFIEGAFKVLENLKTKIENAIVEAKSLRDGKKEESVVKTASSEEVDAPSTDLGSLLESTTSVVEPEQELAAAAKPEQEPAAAAEEIQPLTPEAAAEIAKGDDDDDE